MAKTVIHQDLKSYFGEEDHLKVSQRTKFSDLVFELLSEKKPSESESKIFELILNLSIDHGPETPSALEIIRAAKEGKTLSEAVAAGVLQINDVHGGAIEPVMDIFYQLQDHELHNRKDVVASIVEGFVKEGERLPGYGHRIYKQSLSADSSKEADPRTQLIFDKLAELGVGQEFIQIARELRTELFAQSGKSLTINIDGAIAVALCSLGWNPKLGKAVFIIARVPGLCGQFFNNPL